MGTSTCKCSSLIVEIWPAILGLVGNQLMQTPVFVRFELFAFKLDFAANCMLFTGLWHYSYYASNVIYKLL